MLDHLGMEFEGKAHSGLADSQNIARICLTMLEDGVVFRPTDSIRPENISPEKPFCCIAKPVGKKVWATKHQSAMANLAIRYGVPWNDVDEVRASLRVEFVLTRYSIFVKNSTVLYD